MDSSFAFPYENKQISIEINCCVCCLSKNVQFINLSTCKHIWFLTNFCDLKLIGAAVGLVCLECHGVLKKITKFKSQVEESFKWLTDQTDQIPQQAKRKLPSLKYAPIEISFIINSGPIEFEIKKEPTNQDAEFQATTEIKIEHDGYSDFESEMPLMKFKIKKEIEIVKGKDRKKKKSKDKHRDRDDKKAKNPQKTEEKPEKYKGMIKAVNLTRQELLEERERDRAKESFLKLPYKCDDCIIGFDHEANLTNHLEMRHTEKDGSFLCDVCKSVLSSEGSYKEHCRRHLRRYECEACGVRYNTEMAAVNHYSYKHEEIGDLYTCDTCGYTTKSSRHYRYHKDTHKEKSVCTLCEKTFINKTGLRKHVLSVHQSTPAAYSCESCHKSYSSKSGLRAHEESAHGTPKAYCAPCGKHFKCTATLRNHLQTHSRHRDETSLKYTCDHCNTKFLTKSALQEHIDWIHLKSNKHQCDKCSKTFRTARNLQRHNEFVHEKKRMPRNKICDHCGRGFTTMSILTTHVRTHTGERPLRCDVCGARFAHPAALYTHNKLLHTSKM